MFGTRKLGRTSDQRKAMLRSRFSIFSPIPTNLMGHPVTLRIENAAPPRASPSSFVRTTPVS